MARRDTAGKSEAKVLIVSEDEAPALSKILSSEGYNVILATDDLIGATKEDRPDIAFVDIQYLNRIKRAYRGVEDIAFIPIVPQKQIGKAVSAVRAGAYAYITTPIRPEEAISIAEQAAKSARKSQMGEPLFTDGLPAVIGASNEIKSILKIIRKVAKSDATTILIQGETGTGKGMVARLIHNISDRRDKPFTHIDCTTLPENIIESELFGHERGAFTDAKSLKRGLLEASHGGTAFLDEVGDLPVHLQGKLLNMIEERTFRRVGGVQDIPLDVRIIAATNRNLEDDMARGRFRQDLYYRLSIVNIYIPPLRERREDILPLVRYFLSRFSIQFNQMIKAPSRETERILLRYDWPGNVRELRNVIEEICLLEDDVVILPKHLPARIRRASSEPSPREFLTLAEMERSYIQEVLAATGGNRSKAARILGISRTTLRKKLE
ncbi:MAG: sigma-54 dependent transcriptional regulator [bacterium]